MQVFLLASLVALSTLCQAEQSSDGCTVGHWSEWSRCTRRAAVQEGPKGTSFFLPATRTADRGRAMMSIAREAKVAHYTTEDLCVAEGTCPGFTIGASSGPATCIDGFAGGYPCENIDLLAFLNFTDLGYDSVPNDGRRGRGNDIWGWADPETGDEYALMGLSAGTSFVRVTDPTNPITIAYLPTSTHHSIWRDIKVINNTAYIGSEARDHGMQVFDLLRLRGKTEFSVVEPDYHYTLVGNTHNIVANEETNFIYIVGARQFDYITCQGGLHFVDVSDRLNPQFAGCFADDGYTHDAQCVIYRGPDTRYQGREVCFAYNEDTLTIVDVTNKSHPQMISKEGYTGAMYTHQGWLTEDQTVLLLDDELDEYFVDNKFTKTYIWDVSNLRVPILKNTYYAVDKSIDHNQYILGNYTFQSNYAAGLRILHIDQAKYDLSEVAYFDFLPHIETRAEFEGTWSNYPYLPSRNVIVSSIEFGLYVVRPDYEKIEAMARSRRVAGTQRRVRDVLHVQRGASCPATEHRLACHFEE